MKKLASVVVIACVAMGIGISTGDAKEKILFIDSYHEGYAWSDGVTAGVQAVLSQTDAELKIFRMDTKRNTSKNSIRKAAVDAKMLIESFQPDVVIASDDNASKYVIKPFYKDADLPFVFCGVNWDASMYGFPYKNVTGILEVSPVPELLEYLKPFARGEKTAYLAADVTTARKDGLYYRSLFNLEIDEYYATTFNDWATQYTDIQNTYDILIIGNPAGIEDWDDSAAERIVTTETQIPTGTSHDHMAKYALIGYTKVPAEQGQWAAETALKILRGTDVSTIPIAKNTQGNLSIHTTLASMLNLQISADVLQVTDRIFE